MLGCYIVHTAKRFQCQEEIYRLQNLKPGSTVNMSAGPRGAPRLPWNRAWRVALVHLRRDEICCWDMREYILIYFPCIYVFTFITGAGTTQWNTVFRWVLTAVDPSTATDSSVSSLCWCQYRYWYRYRRHLFPCNIQEIIKGWIRKIKRWA